MTRIFNFNIENDKGLLGIFNGKGIFETTQLIFVWIICSLALLVIPWKLEIGFIMMKAVAIVGMIHITFMYYRTIVKVELDNEALYLTIWNTSKKYLLRDIKEIKLTYYAYVGGFASMRIKGNEFSTTYFITAPKGSEEKYKLYLELKNYFVNVLRITNQ